MEQNLVCAIIENEHIIGLEVYEDLNSVQKKEYQTAVDCTNIPCTMGDLYKDGQFYHSDNGKLTIINPLPDYTEQIETIRKDNQMLIEAFAQTIGGVEV